MLLATVLVCSSAQGQVGTPQAAGRADGSADGSIESRMLTTITEQMAMLEARQERQIAELKEQMEQKDATIAALTGALEYKMEHRQVQLSAGGEVLQLVSEAGLSDLAARVTACEKANADQDAKLGMAMDTRKTQVASEKGERRPLYKKNGEPVMRCEQWRNLAPRNHHAEGVR